MIVSLYAHGMARIEIGRYSMSLDDALAAFLAVCKEANVKPEKIDKTKEGRVVVDLPFAPGDETTGIHRVLYTLAEVEDLRDDPPMRYSLVVVVEPPPGEYVRTGTYND